jgi:O-antigen/teichoic acid export membrane protein
LKTIEHRTFKGTAIGFLSFLISIIHSVVLVPFFLTYWGETKYGQFLGIFAALQLLRTLDTGHQVFIGNRFNLEYHHNKEQAYKTLSSSTIIAFSIGFFEFLIFIVLWLSGLGERIFGLDMVMDTTLVIGISSMLVMWWLVGSIGGILVKAVIAKGLFSEATMFGMIIKIIEIVIISFAIILKFSLASLFIMLALVNFAFSILLFYWVYLRMPEFYPWWKGWDLKIGWSNFYKSMVLTVNGFLEQLNVNGLIFIVSNYLSIALIPVFTTLRTLTNTMNMVTNIFIQPLVPEMVRFHSQENKTKVLRVIQTNWFFSGALVNLGFLLLIPVAENLYHIWTNNKLVFNEGLFYLLILSVILYNYGRGLTSYLSGINDLRAISTITWAKSIILFVVSIIWIKSFGLLSIGIAVLLSEIVGSVILPNHYLQRHLGNEMKLEKSIWQYSVPVIAMVCLVFMLYWFPAYKYIISFLGLVLIVFLYYKQWQMLDIGIKEKFTGLTGSYRQKYLNR